LATLTKYKSPGFVTRLQLALANRRFQSTIVLIGGTPILIGYLFRTLIGPILSPGPQPIDFFEDYVPTGQLVATGGDPYSECLSLACWKGLTNAWSVYPPVVSWLSQPLFHLDHAILGAVALVAAQSCVAVFIIAVGRTLGIRDWRAVVLISVFVVSFPPLVDQVVQRNIEVLLLALSGVWFAGWVAGDRWWGGAALGVGVALKLVQAPLILLGIWFRRGYTTLAAVVVFAAMWLVGAPQLLPEYFLKVLPALNTGTGYAMDIAPVGAVARLLHPSSIFGQGSGVDTTVRVIGLAIAGAVVILTAVALRVPRKDNTGRALEAAAAVAATPLIVAVVRPGHLLLLLLPMVVLGSVAWRERKLGLGLAVMISWLLAGPAYLWYTNLVAAGIRGAFVAPGEEMALAGVVVLWVASLLALRERRGEERVLARWS
jgi:hypothetical protein